MAWGGLVAPHSYEYGNMSRGGPMRIVESQQQVDSVGSDDESNDRSAGVGTHRPSHYGSWPCPKLVP